MSIFRAPSGQISSKRVVGIAYLFLGILLVLYAVLTGNEVDKEILIIVVSTGLTALGISGVEKFGNPNIVRPQSTVNPDPIKPPPPPDGN